MGFVEFKGKQLFGSKIALVISNIPCNFIIVILKNEKNYYAQNFNMDGVSTFPTESKFYSNSYSTILSLKTVEECCSKKC